MGYRILLHVFSFLLINDSFFRRKTNFRRRGWRIVADTIPQWKATILIFSEKGITGDASHVHGRLKSKRGNSIVRCRDARKNRIPLASLLLALGHRIIEAEARYARFIKSRYLEFHFEFYSSSVSTRHFLLRCPSAETAANNCLESILETARVWFDNIARFLIIEYRFSNVAEVWILRRNFICGFIIRNIFLDTYTCFVNSQRPITNIK